MVADDDGEWRTAPEATRKLRLKAKTLQENRVTGGGPKFYKLGPGSNGRVVYRQAELDTWGGRVRPAATSEKKK